VLPSKPACGHLPEWYDPIEHLLLELFEEAKAATARRDRSTPVYSSVLVLAGKEIRE
jgi:hypothetical protein